MMKMVLMNITMMFMMNKNNKIIMTMLILMFNLSMQKKTVSKISYMMMGDLISFWVTDMTLMIMFLMMFMKMKKEKMYFILMSTMNLTLMMTFFNWNFLMFYIMFEISMVLILMIIILWGYQPERMEAMMFMIVMTLMFSLPFLFNIMLIKNMNFWLMEKNMSLFTTASFLLIFMMKMPIYFMHFWLPKVHVEAPVHGSMILAAIMLKMGCYGMMRMEKIMVKFYKLKPMLMAIGMWSMIILSMTCIMQTDIKTLIAYSSIVHMTMVFTNIMMMKTKSFYSSILIIIGHGMCSASLFMMANIMYNTSKSRSMLLNKSVNSILPSMNFMWFMTCMNNAPMPPSMNMMGELISFKNLASWSANMIILIFLVAFTSSMYSIYLFCSTTHGKFSMMINSYKMETSKEMLILTAMNLTLIVTIIKPSILMI